MGLLVTMVGTAYTVMRGLALPHATWWPSVAGALAWFILNAMLAVTLARRQRSRPLVQYSQPVMPHQISEATHPCLATAIAQAADGVVITDVQGSIEYINPAFTLMTGYPAEAVIGQNPRLLKSDQQDPAFYQDLWQTILAGQVWHGELVNRRRDGTCYRDKMSITPVRDVSGGITHFIAIKQDVTELRATEAALRATEIKYRTLIEHANDAIVVIQDGRIVYRNPVLEHLLGHSPEDTKAAAGRSFLDFVAPEDRECVREYSQRRLRGEPVPDHYEISLFSLHERRTIVEVRPSLMDYEGRPATLVVLRDITARKQGEQQLAEANTTLQQEIAEHRLTEVALLQAKDAAEAATRAKSEFLGNMSHELRTPMNGLLGMTELALDTELTPEQRDYLLTVRDSGEALLDLLNDILDFSMIDAGTFNLNPLPFALRAYLAATLQPLAAQAQQKSLKLAFAVHPEVPDQLVGDPCRLGQILCKLVENAIKFTARGEVTVTVDTAVTTDAARPSSAPEPGMVVLHCAVRDTGIGIPTAKQALIFEAFTQGDGSMTRKYGGSGLGLSIAAQLVERMGGQIWVESAEGQGSIFHLTMRLSLQSASEEVGSTTSPAAAEALSNHETRYSQV
jgi:PAS domain S-box-containing protein